MKTPSFPHDALVRRLATLALAAGSLSSAQALTPAEVFAKVSPSVWHVRTYDRDGLRHRQGSAVVVDERTAVTNCHVLFWASRIVLSHGKTSVEATLRLSDPERDICELHAPQLKAPSVSLASMQALAVGQPAYAVGSPLGLELTLSAGLVSSLRNDDAGRLRTIQTTAPISSGSSGGGLFDDRGRLIGITSATAREESAQNLNFAIPASYWLELPERHAAAARAVAEGKPSPLAKALVPRGPSITFKPSVTMPANPARSAFDFSDRVPFLNEAGQARFRQEFLKAPYPRAFALSDNGASAVASGLTRGEADLPPDPQERALAACERLAGKPCVVYALDGEVVFQPPPARPAGS